MSRPHPRRPLHFGMQDGELDGKPYAKFWNPRLAPLAAPVREALAVGAVAAALLPAREAAARLDDALVDGFGLGDDGSLHVAVRTPLPGATPAMIDWWFAWHSDEPQRYKLWHPRAHVHAAWDAPGRGYVGRTSSVDEYLGSEMSHLAISFVPPAELGFGALGEATAVENGRDLLVHCAQEMAHLASFLPALHAELADPR